MCIGPISGFNGCKCNDVYADNLAALTASFILRVALTDLGQYALGYSVKSRFSDASVKTAGLPRRPFKGH